MRKTNALVRLLTAPAEGLRTLEGQNTTCADVFFVWVSIAWHLEKLLADPDSYLHDMRQRIIGVFNARFELMMENSPHKAHLLAFYLDPGKSLLAIGPPLPLIIVLPV